MVAGLASASFGQGLFLADNHLNTSLNSADTSGGLFWLNTGNGAALINEDFNLEIMGGSASTGLGLLVSDVSAYSSVFLSGNGDGAAAGPGTFLDVNSENMIVPGAPGLNSGFLQLFAWTGTDTSFAAAQADGSYTASSGVFAQPLAAQNGNSPVPTMTGMPAMVLSTMAIVPEPATFALLGLGAASLMIFRRRK